MSIKECKLSISSVYILPVKIDSSFNTGKEKIHHPHYYRNTTPCSQIGFIIYIQSPPHTKFLKKKEERVGNGTHLTRLGAVTNAIVSIIPMLVDNYKNSWNALYAINTSNEIGQDLMQYPLCRTVTMLVEHNPNLISLLDTQWHLSIIYIFLVYPYYCCMRKTSPSAFAFWPQ